MALGAPTLNVCATDLGDRDGKGRDLGDNSVHALRERRRQTHVAAVSGHQAQLYASWALSNGTLRPSRGANENLYQGHRAWPALGLGHVPTKLRNHYG